ncbi:MAG TPA: hypothetical protein VMV89_01100, partial [Candidatus Paceibacterota bacterium]|nr:hypothetical protein [Candidatus Paceibacterota bacterium]
MLKVFLHYVKDDSSQLFLLNITVARQGLLALLPALFPQFKIARSKIISLSTSKIIFSSGASKHELKPTLLDHQPHHELTKSCNNSKNEQTLAKSDTSFDIVFSTNNPVQVRP